MNSKSNMPPREKGISGAVKEKDNQHNRDISSKTIFDNAVLCAQFLRDNFDLPLLKDVQPEDIEDMSDRYYPYLGTEFSSDSVKRIRILGIDREKNRDEPPFLVSLIDHKSLVDYDVPMQLLRYMMCIWTEYRREKEAERTDCTRRRGFRYPVIIPIVYYEGKEKWTAGTHFRDRIRDSTEYGKWIPDFEYQVIRIHDYSDRELLERGDEMSLVMLINKIQSAADLENFIRIPPEQMNRILKDSPKHVLEALVSVIESLCFKIGVSAEERTQCVQKVEARDMGYLFENMEKINIEEERRKVREMRKEADEMRVETDKMHEETEKMRVETDKMRVEAEKMRVEAEKMRKEADEMRVETDKMRVEAEKMRKEIEKERQKAAEERGKTAEQRRKTEKANARAEKEHQRAVEAEEKLRLAEEMIRKLQER